MNETTLERGRGEIEDLLPWYANGRISPADRRRVEAALAVDAELARRLELVREEMAETIAANEAIAPPASKGVDRLMAAIDAEPVRRTPLVTAVKTGLMERIGEMLAALAPRRLAYAAAAIVAVVALQSVAITGLVGGRDAGGGYQTASQGATTAAGPSLLVAFAPEAKIADVAGFLKRHGATVAEGPKANGFFRLRLAPGTDAARIAEAMKAEAAIVGFVQVTP